MVAKCAQGSHRPLAFFVFLMVWFFCSTAESSAQNLEFEPVETHSEAFLGQYPHFSFGLGGGFDFTRNDLVHSNHLGYSYGLDLRHDIGGRNHLRAVYRRHQIKELSTLCRGSLGYPCPREDWVQMDQYDLLFGGHFSWAKKSGNWTNVEWGPSLLHWNRNGDWWDNTNLAMSVQINVLLGLNETVAADLGVNFLLNLESKVGHLWGTMVAVHGGLNFH